MFSSQITCKTFLFVFILLVGHHYIFASIELSWASFHLNSALRWKTYKKKKKIKQTVITTTVNMIVIRFVAVKIWKMNRALHKEYWRDDSLAKNTHTIIYCYFIHQMKFSFRFHICDNDDLFDVWLFPLLSAWHSLAPSKEKERKGKIDWVRVREWKWKREC